MSITSIQLGGTVQSRVTFTDYAGSIVDPTEVEVAIKTPSGDDVSAVYPGGIDKISPGVFVLNYVPPEPGEYYLKWFTTGTIVAAKEVTFRVISTKN